MVYYRNLNEHEVETFWHEPTLPKLLVIIRDNLNQNPNGDLSRLLSATNSNRKSPKTALEKLAEDGRPCYRDPQNKTWQKIRSLTDLLSKAIQSDCYGEEIADQLRAVLENSDIVHSHAMRKAMDVCYRFINARKFDLESLVETHLQLFQIQFGECATVLEDPFEDKWAISLDIFGIGLGFHASTADRLASLNELIASRPAPNAAYAVRGKLYMQNGDYLNALYDFCRVGETTNSESGYLIEQCVCHFQLSHFAAARDNLERWIQREQSGYISYIDFASLEKLPTATTD